MAQELDSEKRDGVRSHLITKIWGCATGMLGISIPLVAVTHSGAAIPIAVIVGAAVGTVAIWNPFARTSGDGASHKELTDSTKKIGELEERLASMEAILSYEEKILESKTRKREIEVPAYRIEPDLPNHMQHDALTQNATAQLRER